jgi:hypothetical protein
MGEEGPDTDIELALLDEEGPFHVFLDDEGTRAKLKVLTPELGLTDILRRFLWMFVVVGGLFVGDGWLAF